MFDFQFQRPQGFVVPEYMNRVPLDVRPQEPVCFPVSVRHLVGLHVELSPRKGDQLGIPADNATNDDDVIQAVGFLDIPQDRLIIVSPLFGHRSQVVQASNFDYHLHPL